MHRRIVANFTLTHSLALQRPGRSQGFDDQSDGRHLSILCAHTHSVSSYYQRPCVYIYSYERTVCVHHTQHYVLRACCTRRVFAYTIGGRATTFRKRMDGGVWLAWLWFGYAVSVVVEPLGSRDRWCRAGVVSAPLCLLVLRSPIYIQLKIGLSK